MIVLVLLIINLIIAIAYIVWNVLREKRSFVFKAVVMILCPVVGPIFVFLSYVWYQLLFREEVDLEDVVFSKERVKSIVRANEEQESNMVSLEEAIAVTGQKELRGLMMNIVRGDIKKFLAAISLALNSEDTETAHYAASVLQDALNDFRVNVEKQYQLVLQQDENQSIYAEALIEYMNQVLEQKVFTDMEQKSYVDQMDQVCEIFYTGYSDQFTSSQFEAISMRLLEVEDYEGCRKWCERAKIHYPNTLSTYTCQLKLYFNSGQKENFFRAVEELKKSSVVVDKETLELLRVFSNR